MTGERGSNLCMVVTRARGFPQSLPRSYDDFLEYSASGPNATGFNPYSLAWRGRNRPAAFNCRFAFATTDSDFTPFDPGTLNGRSGVTVTDIYGAARRRTLLWGRRILVNSAQFMFVNRDRSIYPTWSDYMTHAVAGVSDYKKFEGNLIPNAQIRLLSSMQTFAQSGRFDPDKGRDKEFGRLLDLRKLFQGLTFESPQNQRRPLPGSRMDERLIWSSVIVVGGEKRAPHITVDNWSATPVILPPVPFLSAMNEVASFSREQGGTTTAGPFDLGLVIRREQFALDDAAVTRVARTLEHFSAHAALLLHVRRFVDSWWDAIINPPSWDDKETAAANFLREWEQLSLNITPLWSLGANDVQIDPSIVRALDSATQLSGSWAEINRRLADLLRYTTFSLRADHPRVYLGRKKV